MRFSQSIILLVIILLFNSCEPFSLYLQGQKPAQVSVRGKTMYLNGVLGKVSSQRIKKALKTNPDIDTLVIIRSNGSVYDELNIEIAKKLHKKGIVTKLLPFSKIASGAVDLFLAGKTRIIPKGARIGVHSWKNKAGEAKDLPMNHKGHDLFLNYYREIGVDTSFYWYTVQAADYENIYWLNEDEINQFQLRTE